ncbi:uncharacterized protein LOC111410418 [Olea europaea var. sylvestris]|uniref:uncharacterized protein LOC111410418 n=1 Tax=Olea europaea var. sylvestris TaxID=158386 RepID=UPI000C1D0703|nr:uncharacterized protein LOC111410418 [Olea europaea var. sylvestris]
MGGKIRYPKVFLGFIWTLLLLTSYQVIAKSRVPISDSEIRHKKDECYADIESGLWGQHCKSSVIAKENCALQCLSPVCYELIYKSDPLEEGEKDYVRSSEYKYCMHRVSLGESLDGIKGSFDF